jgi:hypothetical protein
MDAADCRLDSFFPSGSEDGITEEAITAMCFKDVESGVNKK